MNEQEKKQFEISILHDIIGIKFIISMALAVIIPFVFVPIILYLMS